MSGGCLLCFATAGEALLLPVTADTSLFELDPTFNMGSQRDLPAGTLGEMGQRKRSRLLFQVDLGGSEALSSGAEILAARYRVRVTMAPESGRADGPFRLHRVLTPWGEGEKRGDIPGGQPASDGEATWLAPAQGKSEWALPGGSLGVDYHPEASAEARVTRPGEVVFEFNGRGLDDLQAMRDRPEDNHGWVLLTADEGRAKTARRFASREHRTDPPMLEVEVEAEAVAVDPPIRMEFQGTPGRWWIRTPEIPGRVYQLQSLANFESMTWQTEPQPAEKVQGWIRFSVLSDEKRRFFRIFIDGQSSPAASPSRR